jgi:hypothetical protein
MLPSRRCPVPSLSSGRWPFFGGAKPPDLDIWYGVGRPGICETKSYMEKLIFIRACLSNVRVIMVIYVCTLGRVATSGGDGMDYCTWVPAARRAWGLWPCSVVSDGKCCRFSRPRRLVKSTWYWKLLDGATGCPDLSQVEEGAGSGRHVEIWCGLLLGLVIFSLVVLPP